MMTKESWTDTDYEEVLSFVERYAWLFVQNNAAVHKPKQVICNLTQLSYLDFRFLQQIHFLLSDYVQESIRVSTPQILQRLVKTTRQVSTVLKGEVKGIIDWNLTVKHRLATGMSQPTAFITRIPTKTYDSPELQALKYLLNHVNRLCLEVLGNVSEEEHSSGYTPNKKWKGEIRSLYFLTSQLLNNPYLQNVELPGKITNMMLQRVRCARNTKFKTVYQSLQLYWKLFVHEDSHTLEDCLNQGILKPLSRDTLYEIYILFVTIASLEQAGWHREQLRLIGYGQGAVALFRHDNSTLRVYYQVMPDSFAENSLYTTLLKKYGFDVHLRRPDIVFELQEQERSYKLIEVKRTEDKGYIVDSVYKTFGYLKDFESSFMDSPLPHAIVVVWGGVEEQMYPEDVVVVLNRRTYQQFLAEKMLTEVTDNGINGSR